VPSYARRALLLVALALALHTPFIGGGFLTDDLVHIERLQRQTIGGVFASPDAFGFYRPIPQASLLLNLRVAGTNPAAMRFANVLLHSAVIYAAYVLAEMLMGTGPGAFFATLAFVLTPKAHPIAVLWISARSELLMALLSLAAIMCWIRWHRGQGRRWLAGAWACYVLALLCKETAALLPLLLLVTPPASLRVTRASVSAVALMVVTAAALFVARARIGALMPASPDPHYDLITPLYRWFRNIRNYFWRAIVSPLALVLFAAVAGFRSGTATTGRFIHMAVYGCVWFVVFIVPVLPIVARSEHYLYLPVFGLCLPAGALTARLLDDARHRGAAVAAIMIYSALIGGFQLSRASAIHDDAIFASRFAEAVRMNEALRDHRGTVVVLPDDPLTRRFLQDAVGGYMDSALRLSLGRTGIEGAVAKPQPAAQPDALWVTCRYADGRVTLRRGQPP
jgi:Dolichyl-phosphate-mannose-protein mannosyltransferase